MFVSQYTTSEELLKALKTGCWNQISDFFFGKSYREKIKLGRGELDKYRRRVFECSFTQNDWQYSSVLWPKLRPLVKSKPELEKDINFTKFEWAQSSAKPGSLWPIMGVDCSTRLEYYFPSIFLPRRNHSITSFFTTSRKSPDIWPPRMPFLFSLTLSSLVLYVLYPMYPKGPHWWCVLLLELY